MPDDRTPRAHGPGAYDNERPSDPPRSFDEGRAEGREEARRELADGLTAFGVTTAESATSESASAQATMLIQLGKVVREARTLDDAVSFLHGAARYMHQQKEG